MHSLPHFPHRVSFLLPGIIGVAVVAAAFFTGVRQGAAAAPSPRLGTVLARPGPAAQVGRSRGRRAGSKARRLFARGRAYETGRNVARNYASAFRLYRAAAAAGSRAAGEQVGVFYQKGWGVGRNYAKAAQWFRREATAGNAASEARLGILYNAGLGVTQNAVAAYQCFRRAARAGNLRAMNNLGVF